MPTQRVKFREGRAALGKAGSLIRGMPALGSGGRHNPRLPRLLVGHTFLKKEVQKKGQPVPHS